MGVELICTNCGREAFLKREPVYEGFKKTGEVLSCSSCGFVFESEEAVRFKAKSVAPQIFTEADKSPDVKIFAKEENKAICRYCADYVVNPFVQFCARHKKEVQATDSCARFSPAGGKPVAPLGGL